MFSAKAFFKGIQSLRFVSFLYCILAMFVAKNSIAETSVSSIYISVLPGQALLTYPQNVRLSQVLVDAYAQTDYSVYSLGTALIDPDKQPMVEVQKQKVLRQLMQLNTFEALNMVAQLSGMRFAYYQSVETNPNRVLTVAKNNPLLDKDFWLYLPERPNHIKIINPQSSAPSVLGIQYNAELRDYLAKLAATKKSDQPYDSVWIIQGDRKVYQINNLTWEGERHYLSPGAILFIGLQNLPYEFRDLNGDIAQLLSHRLEL